MKEDVFTAEQLKKYLKDPSSEKVFKFIKVGTEYRFTPAFPYGGWHHKDLLEEGEEAIAAGTFSVTTSTNEVLLIDTHPITLQLYSGDEHIEEIAILLGRKVGQSYFRM